MLAQDARDGALADSTPLGKSSRRPAVGTLWGWVVQHEVEHLCRDAGAQLWSAPASRSYLADHCHTETFEVVAMVANCRGCAVTALSNVGHRVAGPEIEQDARPEDGAWCRSVLDDAAEDATLLRIEVKFAGGRGPW